MRAVRDQLHLVARLEHATQVLAHVGVVVRDDDASLARAGNGRRRPGRLRRGDPAQRLLHVGLGGTERRRSGLLAHPVRRKVGAAARDTDLEGGPVTGAALDRDPTPVQPHDVVHQGETNARALVRPRLRPLHPVEALEEVRQLVCGDAAAGVADPEERRVPLLPHAHLHRAREGELERVGQEVEHHPFPHVAVDVHGLGQRRSVDLEPQPRAVEGGPEARREVTGELCEIRGPEGGVRAPRLEARELEERVDQALQAERVPVDEVEALARRRHAGDDRLLHWPEEEGQRGPELMADVVEEGGLGAIQLGELRDSPPLRLEGPGVRDGAGHLSNGEREESAVARVPQRARREPSSVRP